MRILFSSLGYPTKKHPFAAFIAAIAEEFAKRGHEVTVIAPQSITRNLLRGYPTLPCEESVEIVGAKYPIRILRPKAITFGDGKFRGKLTIMANKTSATKCLSNIKDTFDVVYAHFWEAAYNVLSYVEQNKLPLIIVSGEDKINLHRYMRDSNKKRLQKLTYKLIGVSSKNVKESVENGLALESSSIVIPNGPDMRKFHPIDKLSVRRELNIPEDFFVVAFTGRFIHRKGALRVEEAIECLEDGNIKAIFIGSTMKDEDAAQEPIGKEILFKGIVNHSNLPKWLNAADVFVLPTLAEGCSNAIVEAMGCGLPIISSDMDFNYDILNQSNSFMINPLDIEEIADKIKYLKDNPQIRENMGIASYQKAKDISFENRVDKIINIIKDAVDENNRI